MKMLRAVWNQIRLTWRLLRDPRVPLWTKIIPFAGFIYVVSPLDLIPDVLIGVGQLDDLGIILAGMRLFETVAPPEVVAEHREALARSGRPLDIIDTPRYRITRESDKAKR